MVLKGDIIFMTDREKISVFEDGYLSVKNGIVEKVYSNGEFPAFEFAEKEKFFCSAF